MLSKKGFSLVETLVAMFLFALVLILLIKGFAFTYQLNFIRLVKYEAVKIAQEEMEELRNGDYTAIVSRCGTCNPNSSDTNCRITRKVRNKNVNFGLNIQVVQDSLYKRVTITVCAPYKDFSGNDISYTLTSLIANREG